MPRFKERKKFIHKPSTKEIFYCLTNASSWVQLLLDDSSKKPYCNFLKFILQKKFFEDFGDRLTIKRISEEFEESQLK
jgi:hypothetical protein